MIFQEFLTLFEKDKIDLFVVKPIGNHAGPAVTGIGVLGKVRLVQGSGWGIGDAVLIDIGIDPVGGRAADRAKEAVEPTMDRAVGNRVGKVRLLDPLDLSIGNEVSFLIEEGHANVPLANTSGGISLFAEHLGEGEAALFDQAGSLHTRKDAFHARTKSHPSGEQAIPGGCAYSGWAVGIGKTHPLPDQAVQVGRRNFGFRIVATQVPVTQIICQNEQDVRLARIGPEHTTQENT